MMGDFCNDDCKNKTESCEVGFGCIKINRNGIDFLSPCRIYFLSTMRKRVLDKSCQDAHIPWEKIKFNAIDGLLIGERKVKEKSEIRAELEGIKKNILLPKPKNLWLYGITGTGKTTIAFALFMHYFQSKERGVSHAIAYGPREMERGINWERGSRKRLPKVVMIDDVVGGDGRFDAIARKAYADEVRLIVTSNKSPGEILVDARNADRLQFYAVKIIKGGDSFRKEK